MPRSWAVVPSYSSTQRASATPRALARSYVEPYVDFTGAVKAYAVVDLRVLGRYDWRLSESNVWKVEQMLLDWPHRPLRTATARVARWRQRYRAFMETHDYKPWRFYPGRERWMPLPMDYRRRG